MDEQLIVSLEEALIVIERIIIVVLMKAPSQTLLGNDTLISVEILAKIVEEKKVNILCMIKENIYKLKESDINREYFLVSVS